MTTRRILAVLVVPLLLAGLVALAEVRSHDEAPQAPHWEELQAP